MAVDTSNVVTQTDYSAYPVRHGKVRDIYDLGETILLVATDRISAYDVVLPTAIPGKGVLLTQISKFWFDFFDDSVPHHLLEVIEDQEELEVVTYVDSPPRSQSPDGTAGPGSFDGGYEVHPYYDTK